MCSRSTAGIGTVAVQPGSSARRRPPSVPRALDVDDARGQVDVLPAQREQLAAAQAGVHRRRPQRPVSLRQRVEQRLGLRRRGDPLAPALDGGQLEARRRVHGDLAAGDARRKIARRGISVFRTVLGRGRRRRAGRRSPGGRRGGPPRGARRRARGGRAPRARPRSRGSPTACTRGRSGCGSRRADALEPASAASRSVPTARRASSPGVGRPALRAPRLRGGERGEGLVRRASPSPALQTFAWYVGLQSARAARTRPAELRVADADAGGSSRLTTVSVAPRRTARHSRATVRYRISAARRSSAERSGTRQEEPANPVTMRVCGSARGTGPAGLEPATPGFGDRCSAS